MPTAYGFDVLETEPNRREDPKVTTRRAYRQFDPRTGLVDVVDVPGIGATQRTFSWFCDGRPEAQTARDFLTARKGSLVPTWVPTWNRDLVLTAPMISTDTVFTVAFCGYTANNYPNKARRYIAFLLPSGAKIYRKVIGASASTTTETLTIDSQVGAAIPQGTMISFLVLSRLATDDVGIKWHHPALAELTFDLVEIPREVPA